MTYTNNTLFFILLFRPIFSQFIIKKLSLGRAKYDVLILHLLNITFHVTVIALHLLIVHVMSCHVQWYTNADLIKEYDKNI